MDVLRMFSNMRLTEREIALLNTVVLFQPGKPATSQLYWHNVTAILTQRHSYTDTRSQLYWHNVTTAILTQCNKCPFTAAKFYTSSSQLSIVLVLWNLLNMIIQQLQPINQHLQQHISQLAGKLCKKFNFDQDLSYLFVVVALAERNVKILIIHETNHIFYSKITILLFDRNP